jgi:hypothetical protein
MVFDGAAKMSSEHKMKKPDTRLMLMLMAGRAISATNAAAAEKFQKLSGTQMRARLPAWKSATRHIGGIFTVETGS